MSAIEAAIPSAPTLGSKSQPAIRVRNLRKTYGEIEAVRGIDLDVQAGEIFGLIGPDGAGKTSVFQILGCVACLMRRSSDVDGDISRSLAWIDSWTVWRES